MNGLSLSCPRPSLDVQRLQAELDVESLGFWLLNVNPVSTLMDVGNRRAAERPSGQHIDGLDVQRLPAELDVESLQSLGSESSETIARRPAPAGQVGRRVAAVASSRLI